MTDDWLTDPPKTSVGLDSVLSCIIFNAIIIRATIIPSVLPKDTKIICLFPYFSLCRLKTNTPTFKQPTIKTHHTELVYPVPILYIPITKLNHKTYFKSFSLIRTFFNFYSFVFSLFHRAFLIFRSIIFSFFSNGSIRIKSLTVCKSH